MLSNTAEDEMRLAGLRPGPRRLRCFIVPGRAVACLMKCGERTINVQSGCPESARFFTAYFDNLRNSFMVIMEDESFELVGEGAEIRIMPSIEVTERNAGATPPPPPPTVSIGI